LAATRRSPAESETVVGEGGARDFSRNPYAGYEDGDDIGAGHGGGYDDRLHPKAQVLGISHGGVARAYPTPAVREAGVVDDDVGGLPVVVTTPGETPVAYVREVDGKPVEFAAAARLLAAAGSRWRRSTGDAVDGSHEGRASTTNDVSPQFQFVWLEFDPDTELYGG